MDYRITKDVKDASEFLLKMACEKKYGDITVTLTMKDGIPVKITKTYCEFHVERKTARLVVDK